MQATNPETLPMTVRTDAGELRRALAAVRLLLPGGSARARAGHGVRVEATGSDLTLTAYDGQTAYRESIDATGATGAALVAAPALRAAPDRRGRTRGHADSRPAKRRLAEPTRAADRGCRV